MAAAVHAQPSGEPVLVTRGLTKHYGDKVAVDHLDLEIYRGELFGLLGPNGAGKTTTILMLLGLSEPSDGQARVLGIDPLRDALAIKRRVSYLPDNVGFYEDMTAFENLAYTAELNGQRVKKERERLMELLETVGLGPVANQPVSTFSHGMKQRLGLADVLVKDPEIIILDEPTNGLDPEGTEEFLQFFRRLSRDEGRTVLISSHLLTQMQEVCDRVGLFVSGHLEAVGPVSSLGEQLLKGQDISIELQIDDPQTESVNRAMEVARSVDGVRRAGLDQQGILVRAQSDVRAALSRALAEAGITVVHLRLRGAGLNDIYLRYFRGDDNGQPE